jgi:hypothetical protein
MKSDIKQTVLLDSRMANAHSEVKDRKLMLIDEADEEDLEACELPEKRRKKMDTEEDSSFAI